MIAYFDDSCLWVYVLGYSSYLGWEWSGGEFMTVVTRGFEHQSLSQPFQLSTTVGHTMGGVAGGLPPHKGGPKARPHRIAVVSDQWSVISSQWPEKTALALLGAGNWLSLSRYQRCTKVHPILDCTLPNAMKNLCESYEPGWRPAVSKRNSQFVRKGAASDGEPYLNPVQRAVLFVGDRVFR